MTDPVTNYQDAFARLSAAEDAICGIANLVRDVSRSLERLPVLKIAGGKLEPATPDPAVLNIEKWPSSEGLKAVIIEWQSARQQVEALWTAIPRDRQLSLVPPSGAPGGKVHGKYTHY
jgi:hypothetical protein